MKSELILNIENLTKSKTTHQFSKLAKFTATELREDGIVDFCVYRIILKNERPDLGYFRPSLLLTSVFWNGLFYSSFEAFRVDSDSWGKMADRDMRNSGSNRLATDPSPITS